MGMEPAREGQARGTEPREGQAQCRTENGAPSGPGRSRESRGCGAADCPQHATVPLLQCARARRDEGKARHACRGWEGGLPSSRRLKRHMGQVHCGP